VSPRCWWVVDGPRAMAVGDGDPGGVCPASGAAGSGGDWHPSPSRVGCSPLWVAASRGGSALPNLGTPWPPLRSPESRGVAFWDRYPWFMARAGLSAASWLPSLMNGVGFNCAGRPCVCAGAARRTRSPRPSPFVLAPVKTHRFFCACPQSDSNTDPPVSLLSHPLNFLVRAWEQGWGRSLVCSWLPAFKIRGDLL